VYRNWFQDFNKKTIVQELTANGFAVKNVWSDLTGQPYEATTPWIGVVAQKKK
jgi:hypothetical protein